MAGKFNLPEDELEAELLDTDDDVAEVALVAGFLDLFAFTMELPKKMTKFFKTGNFRELRGTSENFRESLGILGNFWELLGIFWNF